MPMPFMEQTLNFLLGQKGRRIVARQIEGGYSLLIKTEEGTLELHKQRGGVRTFRTLDSIGSLLRARGAPSFIVKLKTDKEGQREMAATRGAPSKDDIF